MQIWLNRKNYTNISVNSSNIAVINAWSNFWLYYSSIFCAKIDVFHILIPGTSILKTNQNAPNCIFFNVLFIFNSCNKHQFLTSGILNSPAYLLQMYLWVIKQNTIKLWLAGHLGAMSMKHPKPKFLENKNISIFISVFDLCGRIIANIFFFFE